MLAMDDDSKILLLTGFDPTPFQELLLRQQGPVETDEIIEDKRLLHLCFERDANATFMRLKYSIELSHVLAVRHVCVDVMRRYIKLNNYEYFRSLPSKSKETIKEGILNSLSFEDYELTIRKLLFLVCDIVIYLQTQESFKWNDLMVFLEMCLVSTSTTHEKMLLTFIEICPRVFVDHCLASPSFPPSDMFDLVYGKLYRGLASTDLKVKCYAIKAVIQFLHCLSVAVPDNDRFDTLVPPLFLALKEFHDSRTACTGLNKDFEICVQLNILLEEQPRFLTKNQEQKLLILKYLLTMAKHLKRELMQPAVELMIYVGRSASSDIELDLLRQLFLELLNKLRLHAIDNDTNQFEYVNLIKLVDNVGASRLFPLVSHHIQIYLSDYREQLETHYYYMITLNHFCTSFSETMVPDTSVMLKMFIGSVQKPHPRVQCAAASCIMNLGIALRRFSVEDLRKYRKEVRIILGPLIKSATNQEVKIRIKDAINAFDE